MYVSFEMPSISSEVLDYYASQIHLSNSPSEVRAKFLFKVTICNELESYYLMHYNVIIKINK